MFFSDGSLTQMRTFPDQEGEVSLRYIEKQAAEKWIDQTLRAMTATQPGTVAAKGHSIYLVPDQETFGRRRDQFYRLADPLIPKDMPVQMMGGWIRRLLRRFRLRPKRLLPWEQLLLMRRILQSLEPEKTSPLASIWEKPGTLRSLTRFLLDVRREQPVLPDSFPRELSRALAIYDASLEDHDMADLMALVEALTVALEERREYRLEHLVVEGFWDFRPWELKILTAVEPHCHQLSLLIPYDPERADLFPPPEEFRQQLGRLAPYAIGYYPDEENGSLGRALFTSKPTQRVSGARPQVVVERVRHERQQRQSIVHTIKRQIRSGYRPGDCSVIVRDPDLRDEVIRALSQAGVPVVGSTPMSFRETGIGDVVLSVARFLETPSVEHLAHLGSVPYLERWKGLAVIPSYLPDLDFPLGALDQRLKEVRQALRFRRDTPCLVAGESFDVLDGWLAELDQLQAVQSDLRMQLAPYLREPISLSSVVDAIKHLGVLGALHRQLEADGGQSEALVTDLAAWDCLEEQIQNNFPSLYSLPVREEVVPDLSESLQVALESLKVQLIGTPENLPVRPVVGEGVNVMAPEEIFHQRYPVVLMPDCISDRYPRRPRHHWMEAVLDEDVISDRREIRTENRLFYRAVRSATEQIFLIYPEEMEATTPVPSPYINELPDFKRITQSSNDMTATSWQDIRLSLLGAIGPRLSATTWDFLVSTIKKGADDDPAGYGRGRGDYPKEDLLGRVLAAEAERWGPDYGRWDGVVTPMDPESLGMQISASALNSYARCPFRFFLDRVLSPHPRFEPAKSISPLLIGKLYHTILERYYRDIVLELGLDDPGVRVVAQRERLSDLIKRAVERVRPALSWIPSVRWEALEQRLQNELGQLLDAEEIGRSRSGPDSFSPWKFELRFRLPLAELFEDLPVPFDNIPDIEVSGVIDRVDRTDHPESEAPDTAVVFDYKSGTPSDLSDIESGRDFQLPFYLLAAPHLLDLPVEGAGYISIRKRKWQWGLYTSDAADRLGLRNAGMSEDEMMDYLFHSARYALEYLKRMRSGHFPVQPGVEDDCRYCDYALICRNRPSRNRQKAILKGER